MKWFEYQFTDEHGIQSSAVLEVYSDGTCAWFDLNGSDFVVPVPGTNVVIGEIDQPSWAHSDKFPLPPSPPQKVTPRQMRIALTQLGLRSQIEDIVAASDQSTKDTWEYAIEIDRSHPMCNAIASQGGLTEEHLDEIFRVAGGIQ